MLSERNCRFKASEIDPYLQWYKIDMGKYHAKTRDEFKKKFYYILEQQNYPFGVLSEVKLFGIG